MGVRAKLLLEEKRPVRDGERGSIRHEEGKVFSKNGVTMEYTLDSLPPYYVKVNYFGKQGYLKTKGISDLKYVSSLRTKDSIQRDYLLIAYGLGKITENKDALTSIPDARFSGFKQVVLGNDIIPVLLGAEAYSQYDITPIRRQLLKRIDKIRKLYPDNTEPEEWALLEGSINHDMGLIEDGTVVNADCGMG